MRHIASLFKKLIKTLFIGTFTVIISACYGVMMDFRDLLFHVKTPQGDSIPGIKLELLQAEEVLYQNFTDASGDAFFFMETYSFEQELEYTVIISDVDGPENLGEFQPVIMDVSTDSIGTQEYTVVMYPVE